MLLLREGHCLREHAIDACKLRDARKTSRFSASSLLTLIEMVDADLGITFLPEMAEGSALLQDTQVQTYPLGDKSYRTIALDLAARQCPRGRVPRRSASSSRSIATHKLRFRPRPVDLGLRLGAQSPALFWGDHDMRNVQALAAAAAILGFVGAAHAQPFAEAKTSRSNYSGGAIAPKSACDALATAKLDELVEIKATAVPAVGDVPAYCRVSGVLQPEVAFEVNLPTAWNGRFYMIGNGGHAGEALDGAGRTAQRDQALQHGFVMAGTNTGHDARKEPGGTFVLSNPQKAIDYAYRAVHVTATTAKEIATPLLRPSRRALVLELVLATAAARACSRRSAIPTTSTASSPTRRGSIRPASRSARCGISTR